MSKPSTSAVALLLGALTGAAWLLPAAPADATSYGYGRSYHSGYDRPSSHRSRYRSHRSYRSRPQRSASRCSQVSKRAVIDGRTRRVVGTRCYDSRGTAYIVPGSRSVVRHR